MYFDCFPLSKDLPMLENNRYNGFFFFNQRMFFRLSLYTFTIFWQQDLYWWRFKWVKIRKNGVYLRMFPKKFIKAIFNVLMDKMIYDQKKI